MLNHITIMGRLTRDPELRYTQSQTPVASFTLAVDRDFGSRETGEKQTDFIDCVAWRQTAEFVNKYFAKGSMAVVSGRLQIRDWTDNNGGKRRNAEIVVDNIYFGDSKRRDNGESRSEARPATGNAGSYGSTGSYGGAGSYGGFDSVSPSMGASAFTDMGDDDGELPF